MAQTLKFGNKTWATKVGSTLAYNDENDNFKPLPFAFTRSTSATRVNKEGLIEVVTNDRPRIDYTDTSDGVLLLEKAATNLVTYSNDFSNSSYVRNGTTATTGFISPDGTLNAYKLLEDNSNAIHRIYQTATVTGSPNTTISIYVKYLGRKNVLMRIADSTVGRWYDVENGVLGGIYQGTPNDSSIESVGNGWYRISISHTVSNQSRLELWISDTESTSAYQGDTSKGVYIYGAQLEVGSFPTSYIPTQNSAVTRVAETANGAGNSEVFNDSEGVLFADIAYLNPTTSPNSRIAISDGTALNRILIQNVSSTSNRLQFYVISNGVTSTDFFTDLSDITLFNKIVFKYKTNDFSVWINGFEVLTDTSGSTFSDGTLNELAFDGGDGTSDFYGKTKEIGYYNTILTDLELETLTSYRSWESMVNELNLNIIYNG